MDLIGYTNRLDAGPGEAVDFMVSSAVGSFDVEIVQLIHGDPNPSGPGFKSRAIEQLCQQVPGLPRSFPRGSYVVAPADCEIGVANGFSVTAWVYPTLLGTRQGLISLGPRSGFALSIT